MIPKNTIQVEGKNVSGLLKLLDALEEHDDVQNVFRTPTSTRRRWRRSRRRDAFTSAVRVLGIDCGTERTGYGVIDSDGVASSMIEAGVLKTDPKHPLVGPAADDLDWVARHHRALCAGLRRGGGRISCGECPKRSEACPRRGVALLMVAESQIAPRRIFADGGQNECCRLRPGGKGAGADDGAVDPLARAASLPEDASDALAVAICHATRASHALRMRAAQ